MFPASLKLVRPLSRGLGLGVALAQLAACSAHGADPRGEAAQSSVTGALDAPPLPAIGSCHRAADVLVSAADTCAATGSGRVVVKLRRGATCSSLLGVAVGATSDTGLRKRYLFDVAPPQVKELYCVLDDSLSSGGGVGGTSDARAEGVVRDLCASEDIEAAARDCSELPRSSVDPNAYAPPEGEALSQAEKAKRSVPRPAAARAAAAQPVLDEGTPETGRNSCDVCAMGGNRELFVTLPPSFVGPWANTSPLPIVVRIDAPGFPDVRVIPPPNAQSFSVDGVVVPPGATITVYAPGVSPPPKAHAE